MVIKHIEKSPPQEGEGLRLAVFQVKAGISGTPEAIEQNIIILEKGAELAKNHGAHLISFPELFLTGYAFKESNPTAHEACIFYDSLIIKRVQKIAAENQIAIICPYPEKALIAGKMRYYDSMVLIDKNGELLKNYRKTHLWGPGEQELWDFGYVYPEEGEAFTIHKINNFPLGLLNCYEAESPELARILALKGAKLIVIPTAADEWAYVCGKKTITPYPDVSRNLIPAHALENDIFIAYNNYSGTGFITENNREIPQVEYSGNSVITGPHGNIIAHAEKTKESMLIVDCIPKNYKKLHPYDTNYIKDRRPSLYGELLTEKIEYNDYKYPNPPKAIYPCK